MILKVFILMRFSLLNSTNQNGYFRTSAEIGLSIHFVVYKIPYRRARAWPSGCIGRVRARAKESCIQSILLLAAICSYSKRCTSTFLSYAIIDGSWGKR